MAQKDYLILFDESEVAPASERYGISRLLPGYQVLGLRGWDDFILRDATGQTLSAPTVPLDRQHIAPFALPKQLKLTGDPRFDGKIKWYVKPIVFGGDANLGENLIWVDHAQHAELVRWWNELYRSAKR
jgi:hypothetical protein